MEYSPIHSIVNFDPNEIFNLGIDFNFNEGVALSKHTKITSISHHIGNSYIDEELGISGNLNNSYNISFKYLNSYRKYSIGFGNGIYANMETEHYLISIKPQGDITKNKKYSVIVTDKSTPINRLSGSKPNDVIILGDNKTINQAKHNKALKKPFKKQQQPHYH